MQTCSNKANFLDPVQSLASNNDMKHSDQKKSKKAFATNSKGLLHPLSKVNKIGRKAVTRSKNVPFSNKTRQQKIEAVIHSVELLMKDNNRLRLVCRYVFFRFLACIYDVVVIVMRQ